MYRLLEGMGLQFATEVQLFPSFLDQPCSGFKLSCHPTDVFLAKSELLIEVDGEQHFEGDYQKQGWQEQQERDRQVDSAIIEVGYGCVRLHYLDDILAWEATIEGALQQLESQPQHSKGFVTFSPAYKKPLTM